ncbi:MAG: aminotransferase class I/II-fold pyridoxal phosphate-dependent enzyme [Deltaproteobacteria bacterium]|jgi:8-amino-7-oxononanoate synthase|nr:aminotransferase class I/II-fold pyridoxal phosphate-dependent enzyme [Deltaproteobacteria bacterium]
MSLFDKFEQIAAARQPLVERGIRSNVVMEKVISSTEAIINGRPVILAGTNNYLGLTFDPDCIEAASVAIREQGTGTTGSRMANGTYNDHVQLERELADFFGCKNGMVFSTGYIANLAMLSALTGPGDVLLIDADSHASIYDGCRLSGAEVIRFRHNDPDNLAKRLQRLGERSANTLIVVEGIYSMMGDRAPLAEIVGVKEKYGACLLVDEAHSLGVLGPKGCGLAEEAGVEDRVDFVVGTFSKSLGAIGGFCVSNHPVMKMIPLAARPYIFTASSSPSTIASTREALKVLKARPELRRKLWDNAHNLYQQLKELGFELGPEPSPVVAVRVANLDQAIALWKGLLENGVYVNLVTPPATPDGGCLMRCSVSAGHSPEQIKQIGRAFATQQQTVEEMQTA